MRHFYRFILCLLLLVCGLSSYGQQRPRLLVTGDFVHLPFERFVRELELQTIYHIYYDAATVDSLYVTLVAQQQPVQAVLARALQGTSLHVAVEEDEHRAYVYAGEVLTPLAPTFFGPPHRRRQRHPGRGRRGRAGGRPLALRDGRRVQGARNRGGGDGGGG